MRYIFLGGVALLGAFLFFGWQRNVLLFERETMPKSIEQSEESEEYFSEDEANKPREVENKVIENNTEEVVSYGSATVASCENECEDFSDGEELVYCRALCGFEKGAYQGKECENFREEKQKDFCLKEKALEKMEVDECVKIKDAKLRKSCIARVSEEIF